MRALPEYVVCTLRGWQAVALRARSWILAWFASEPYERHLFLFSGVALFLLAIPGWIEYEISFLQRTEVNTVSSNSRPAFAVVGLIIIFLYFFEVPLARTLAYASAGFLALLYLAGFVFPTPLHTFLQKEMDYSFTIWAYLAFVPIAAILLILPRALPRPVFRTAEVKRFFKSGLSE